MNPITTARKDLNLTQAEVAAACGWSTGLQGQYEIGYILPSVDKLRALALVLKVDADRLQNQIVSWENSRRRAAGD